MCVLVCFVYACVQFECTLTLLGCAVLLECSGAFWSDAPTPTCRLLRVVLSIGRIVELSLMKIIMIIISDG